MVKYAIILKRINILILAKSKLSMCENGDNFVLTSPFMTVLLFSVITFILILFQRKWSMLLLLLFSQYQCTGCKEHGECDNRTTILLYGTCSQRNLDWPTTNNLPFE